MEKTKLIQKIKLFKEKKVLVVGDVMLDHYTYGKVDRISPEAPVPIIHIVTEKHVPGGAGNVFLNLCHLGAQTSLLSVVGIDEAASRLSSAFLPYNNCGEILLLKDIDRRTTVKQRLVAGHQQLLRVDTEDNFNLNKKIEKEIISYIENNLERFDCLCISDYSKGVMTEKLAIKIITLAKIKNVPVLVDTKPKNFSFYKGCTLIAPNSAEVMIGYPNMSYLEASMELSKDVNAPVLVTRGPEGVSYITAREGEIFTLPSYAREEDVRDVSGAGDTVVAALSLCLSVGMSPKDSAYVASKAAAIAVSKPHTSPVFLDEVLSTI